MRIISGKYKGRNLVQFTASHIRPTTDRVKESLFNIIQSNVNGSQVLDLFSGTGNLGIEAISRGAQHVTFLESNKKSISIIKKNLELFGIKNEATVKCLDVFKFLKNYSDKKYDLIFIDPPFTEKIADKVMNSISSINILNPGGIIAIESGTKELINDKYSTLFLLDRRKFGDKSLSLYSIE